jgi:zinc finger protein
VADDDPRKMVSKFPVPCYTCDKMGNVQMCYSSIPFFKEIILMAFVCDFCGYRNSEIKEGGGIGEKAKKITLRVKDDTDLNRDIFKSATAKFSIPELGFDMDAGSMGSLYTTVEGLIMKAHAELETNNPFGKGDSKDSDKFMEFLDKLTALRSGTIPFTIILDDPADNCFVYNPMAPEDDPKIEIESYERTAEQNDELGITHMMTDPEQYMQEANKPQKLIE